MAKKKTNAEIIAEYEEKAKKAADEAKKSAAAAKRIGNKYSGLETSFDKVKKRATQFRSKYTTCIGGKERANDPVAQIKDAMLRLDGVKKILGNSAKTVSFSANRLGTHAQRVVSGKDNHVKDGHYVTWHYTTKKVKPKKVSTSAKSPKAAKSAKAPKAAKSAKSPKAAKRGRPKKEVSADFQEVRRGMSAEEKAYWKNIKSTMAAVKKKISKIEKSKKQSETDKLALKSLYAMYSKLEDAASVPFKG